MSGQTTGYRIEPRGEYVFGVVSRRSMLARRGRRRRLVEPGRLVAWDPTDTHSGAAVDGRPWSARLIVVEVTHLHALADDPDNDILADVVFPDPVLTDPGLASSFLELHRSLEAPATRLEQDEKLAEWLHALIGRHAANRPTRPPLAGRDDRALRLALEHLAERPERNVALDELAAAAGIGKFRLVRPFRERTGLPPHALQIAHRLRAARRLLEAGQPRRHRSRDRVRRPKPPPPPFPGRAGPDPGAITDAASREPRVAGPPPALTGGGGRCHSRGFCLVFRCR
jgi:AraC-like DNA-binding protein